MKPYEFFEHPADIGVQVRGATLAELFTHAAQALGAALGQLAPTGPPRQKSITLTADSLEDLLHDWLSELLYEVDTHHVCYDQITILTIGPHQLNATVGGTASDFTRSRVNAEIKAVTYHQLAVQELPDTSWQATVIFDV